MRAVIIAANWKMHTVPREAAELARTIAARTDDPTVVRIVCPPFVAILAVRDALSGSGVAVGAQNVHQETAGAFTGEVSAPMLVGLVEWVIVGHSERRRDAGETDALIAAKVRRTLEAGLRPILCVGEQLAEREAGLHEAVVEAQLRGALAGLADAPPTDGGSAPFERLVVAYEPVWAIGTGRSARGVDAAEMADLIRRTLHDVGAPAAGEGVPVLYGGSTTAANAGEFLGEPGIDGALVGGASLRPDDRAGIVGRAGVTARARAAASR
ncbi:MAG: triose-phosphate isomerase [Candidatus Limnocylindrales bacterium]